MVVVFDPKVEVRKVLKRFPSPKTIRKHSEELIAEYGEPYFNLILQEAYEIHRKTKSNQKIVASQLNYLRAKYEVGERYNFVATGERDANGRQLVRDTSGTEHVLITTAKYSSGDEVRCTVKKYYSRAGENCAEYYLVLDSPRIVNKEDEFIRYVKSPDRWYGEVQGLGRHRYGNAFTCSCCGRDFPANKGWRVNLKNIVFCNSCAKKIYEPSGRGSRHFIISTPMGNKR